MTLRRVKSYFRGTLIILVSIAATISVQAHSKKRHHHAHVHGEGSLDIAFDGLKGSLRLKVPAESVVGFEHEAKSDDDKKKVVDLMQKFSENFSKWVVFDAAKACVFEKKQMEIHSDSKSHESHSKKAKSGKAESSHSDFEAEYDVLCASDLKGTQAKIDFSELPGIKKLSITILVGEKQKSVKYTGKGISVDL